MYIRVSASNRLSLEDCDNFREFSIVEETGGQAGEALDEMASPAEEDHFWLDANAVIELSGRGDDPGWVDAFWKMLEQVEAYGYSNMTTLQVKAHRVCR
jgi:hypothetical protein